jgi:hypothetical protein
LRRGGGSALCAVAFASLIAFVAPAAAEQAPMTFHAVDFASTGCLADCPQVIIADGVIEADTPQAFVDFAKQAAQSERLRGVIFMNSPGGNVVASMELGAAFRRLRAAVVVAGFAAVGAMSGPVAGECFSACVYALMGAVRRVAPPESRIGLPRQIRSEHGRRSAAGLARRVADAGRPAPVDGRRNCAFAARRDAVLKRLRNAPNDPACA